MSNSKESQPKLAPTTARVDATDVPDSLAPIPHSTENSIARQKHASQSKPKVIKSRVGDGSPRLGMATLFPAEEDIARGERAHEKAVEALRAENIDGTEFDWLRSILMRVALFYGVEFDRDERITFSDMKDEVSRLQRDLQKVIGRIDALSASARDALNASVVWKPLRQDASYRDHIAELRAGCAQIDKSCEPIASRKNKRVSHQYRFQKCCADLWQVREKITKQHFSETFEIHDGAFTTYDAAFIHAVMEAIDEKVTASQVQEGLRRAAQAKRKRG